MRILLVTDAWAPQINGVVVTLRNTIAWLERWKHEVHVLSPEGFRTMPMPTYPEIPIALMPGREVARRTRIASSADEATWAWTPQSRRTTSTSRTDPVGSSSWRCMRHASAGTSAPLRR